MRTWHSVPARPSRTTYPQGSLRNLRRRLPSRHRSRCDSISTDRAEPPRMRHTGLSPTTSCTCRRHTPRRFLQRCRRTGACVRRAGRLRKTRRLPGKSPAPVPNLRQSQLVQAEAPLDAMYLLTSHAWHTFATAPICVCAWVNFIYLCVCACVNFIHTCMQVHTVFACTRVFVCGKQIHT